MENNMKWVKKLKATSDQFNKYIGRELDAAMKKEYLEFNEEECTLEAAIEYIRMSIDNGQEMTAREWVLETKENYPECFKSPMIS